MIDDLGFESEDEIDSSDEQKACDGMVPPQRHMKSERGEPDEDHQCNELLKYLQLHQTERSSVAVKPHPVCGHLKAILEESDAPREQNDKNQRGGIREETGLLQFQVTVPRQRHEDIGRQQQ